MFPARLLASDPFPWIRVRLKPNQTRRSQPTPVPDLIPPTAKNAILGQAGRPFEGPTPQRYIRIRTNRVALVGLGAGMVVASVRRRGGHEVAFDRPGTEGWGGGIWDWGVVRGRLGCGW